VTLYDEGFAKVRGYIAADGDHVGWQRRTMLGHLKVDQIRKDEPEDEGVVVRTWIIGVDGSVTWTS
jgi:hypothetical protein